MLRVAMAVFTFIIANHLHLQRLQKRAHLHQGSNGKERPNKLSIVAVRLEEVIGIMQGKLEQVARNCKSLEAYGMTDDQNRSSPYGISSSSNRYFLVQTKILEVKTR